MRAEEPDLAPLDRHFEVLGSNRNSSFTLSNGRRESSTTWQITLMARHAGELTIPAIAVGGERTQPIAIRVSEDPAPASAAAREVQLQVETDAAEVHVQQQLLLTVRLLHAVNLEPRRDAGGARDPRRRGARARRELLREGHRRPPLRRVRAPLRGVPPEAAASSWCPRWASRPRWAAAAAGSTSSAAAARCCACARRKSASACCRPRPAPRPGCPRACSR